MNSRDDDVKCPISQMCLPHSDKYETRVTKIVVAQRNEPIFSENVTHIEIADDAAGEFVKVSQEGGHKDYEKFILFDPEEWPVVREAIDLMISQCRKS